MNMRYPFFGLCKLLVFIYGSSEKVIFLPFRIKWEIIITEPKTLERDILNPDYLILLSNGHTFDFLLKPFFLGYSREKSKTAFFNLESPSHFCL